MNKIRVTAKAIRELPEPKVNVGYCRAQYLLKYRRPFAYTAGRYGWNFDAYDLDGVVLCTGYRGMPGADVDDLAAEYDAKAEEILEANHWIGCEEAIGALVAEFRAKALRRIRR